jgi:predicted glycosyltransferase
MNIAIFINTPAQLHFYRNIYYELERRGHSVHLLSRNYGETKDLVEELGIPSYFYSSPPTSKIGKMFSLPFDVMRAAMYLRDKKIDLITGFGTYDAYTSFLLRKLCIVFTDSEPMVNNFSYAIQYKLFIPFVDAVITPSSFRQNLGKKHIRVNSFKELAYLHPNYYHPNADIFDLLGIAKNEEYVLLRFNAFDAVHDAGIKGFTDEDKIKLVNELEKYAKVFISSETGIPEEIKDRVARIPKSRIHDVLYYAKLLVTDTQTMTTEAALLRTPAIRCNKFIDKNDMGNFIELEKKYGLIFNYNNPKKAIEKAVELIQKPNLKEEWTKKSDIHLKDKTDVTAFMVKFIENYPESLKNVEKSEGCDFN